MKKKFRISRILVALLLALSSLVACTASPSGNNATSEPNGEVEKVTYHIIADGSSDFTIIRPQEIEHELFDRVRQLRRSMEESYGVTVRSESDRNTNGSQSAPIESDSGVHEILIGATNRAESRSVAEEYKALHGYVIKVTNGKIVLWGNDLLQTLEAIAYFEETVLAAEEPSVDEGFCYVNDLNRSGSISAVLAKEFTVVYPSTRYYRDLVSANAVTTQLREITGTKPSSHSDAEAPKGKEILIGATSREASVAIDQTLDYMDYYVKVSPNGVILMGGSPLATENAVHHFNNAILTGEITSPDQEYEYRFDFDPYIQDSLIYHTNTFVPAWAKEFSVPAWLTDFEEKLYAITCPTGRMTGDSHRGDTQYYPENSLPAILSAILLGADTVEIDVRLTKDNIMVLMHDESLKRTTNWSQMQGKNGLPTSDKIQDWTYEQLQQLSLKHNDTVTQYKIPTAYEALSLFDRCTQVHFDCKIDSIEKNADVYLLARELGVKECFLYYYGVDTMKTWVTLDPEDAEFRETVEKLEGYLSLPGHALRRRKYDLVDQYGDTAEGWCKQYDAGYKMVFTNKIYDLSRYLAQNQEPLAP